MIDASKILLEHERCTHLTKRLNRLSKWNFFKVLNRVSMGKIFAVNILVLCLFSPIVYLLIRAMTLTSNVQNTLPYYGSLILGTGVWTNVADYLAQQTLLINQETLLWCLLGALPAMFVFSGVFAIIRDAFWIGSINVFKCFVRGVKANIAYSAISTVILEGMVFGIFVFYWWSATVMVQWLSILLTVLLCLVAMLVAIYLFILCSVTVTYKQSVKQNLADSWRLMWLNIVSNLLNFIITIVPVLLYVFMPSTLQTLVLMFLLLWGAFWIPFVWQTHMMKTFALFHPVLVNKKGEPKGGTREVNDEMPEKENKGVPAAVRKEAEEQYKKHRNKRLKEKTRKSVGDDGREDGEVFVNEDGQLVKKVVKEEDMVSYEILEENYQASEESSNSEVSENTQTETTDTASETAEESTSEDK